MDVDDEAELLALGYSRCLIPINLLGATLWRCEKCGALVGDLARHHEWHRETS